MSKIGNVTLRAAGRVEAQVMYKNVAGKIVPRTTAKSKTHNVITTTGLGALQPNKNSIHQFSSLSAKMSIGVGSQAELQSVNALAIPARVVTGKITKNPPFRIENHEGTGKTLVVQEIVVTARYEPDGTERNYSEVGLGEGPNLHTYTVFKNSETLEPETLTVLGDEYLDVVYFYQVQSYVLSGFTFNAFPGFNDTYNLLADHVDNQPLGPFPMSGEGVEEGTEAYALLFPQGNGKYDAYTGIFYFDAPNPLWDPSTMIPQSEFVPVSSTSSSSDNWSLESGWTNTASNRASGARYNMRYPAERRPLPKEVNFSKAGGLLVAGPGVLTSDKDIYVVGHGGMKTGGIVWYTKPILVTKDSRFQVTADLFPLWESSPAVNAPFIPNPED